MIDFEKNMGLVYFVYQKKFSRYSYLKDDLCQEGFIALFNSCKTFDENKGILFCTYATRSIYNNMLGYLLRKELKYKFRHITFSELSENNVDPDYLSQTPPIDEDLIFLKDTILNNSAKLSEKNKAVIYSYLFEDLTQYDIAEKFNFSQPHICRLIKKFKNKIKEDLNADMQ